MQRQGEVDEAIADPSPDAAAPSWSTPFLGRWVPDSLGVVWTLLAAALVLWPALHPGVSLGPFDLLSRFGLTRQAGVTVHNSVQADQIQQFIPWTDLAWHQVHSGQLPLWNQYNVLGLPLAFNWQSSVFSVPTLLSYLFPVRYAYTVIVLVKLMVAGTGAYVLCRVLGLGVLSAAFGGTVFELSGPIVDHAGWPHTAVTCWSGWILAAVVLLVRGRHRLRDTALLGLFVAFAVYGGHPESLVVLAVAVLVFIVVWVPVRARMDKAPVARPLVRLLVAALCGLGLSAPLWLPGAQLGLTSVRNNGSGVATFPLSHLPDLVAAGFQGNDFRTAAYVGIIALALALVGVWMSWRRPEVLALGALSVVTAGLTYLAPLAQLLHHVPGGRTITWSRSVMLLALGLATLAAFGIEAVVRFDFDRGVEAAKATATRVGGAFLATGALVVLLVAAVILRISHLAQHKSSLVWPAVEAAVGLGVAGVLWWRARQHRPSHARTRLIGRCSAVVLFAVESAFLLGSGVTYWSVSSTYFASNPAITALQRKVGSSLVGFGSCHALRYLTASTEVGIRPDANVGYGIREMVIYDPILPEAYLRSWKAAGGNKTPPTLARLGLFCARLTTIDQARLYGVQYLLEPRDRHPPRGAVPHATIGNEELYLIPGAADATVVPVVAGGGEPSLYAPGEPVSVTHPDTASWRVGVDDSGPQVLRLRLSNVPGWRATIDGRPLTLEPWASGAMLEARIPSGRHVIELHYWPSLFSAGLLMAAGVLVALGATTAVALGRGRSARRSRAITA